MPALSPSPTAEASPLVRLRWRAKHAVKSTVNSLLETTQLHRSLGRLSRNRAAVLFYRAVGFDWLPICSDSIIEEAVFRRQMEYLAEHKRVISLETLVDAIRTEGSPPPDAVVLTFDDGFVSNHDVVAPILAELGLTATFFVVVGFTESEQPKWDDYLRALSKPYDKWAIRQPADAIEALLESTRAAAEPTYAEQVERDLRRGMLTFEQMRSLVDAGFSVQSHGYKHWYLSSQSYACQEREISESKRILESRLGVEVKFFSVPFGYPGSFDADTVELLREHGYVASFGGHEGYLTARSDLYAMPRLVIHRGVDFERFRLLVSGCYV